MEMVRSKKLADVPQGIAVFLRLSGTLALLFLVSSPFFVGGGVHYPRLSLLWFFGMLLSLGLSAGAVPAYFWLGRGRLKDWDRASLRPLFRPFLLVSTTVAGYVGFIAIMAFIYN